MNLERWLILMKALGLGEHREMFARVHDAYTEPQRRYHTTAHIDACLREFDPFRSLARSAGEVEAALWFHDVIYSPKASDNESRSADLAGEFLDAAGAAAEVGTRVREHIMATRHDSAASDRDSSLVVDVDLSILGQEPAVYDEFEIQVREEYEWVPEFLFRRKRAEILRSFLERGAIYATPQFRDRYEASARANLARALDRLAK